jgi:hypothetical protein
MECAVMAKKKAEVTKALKKNKKGGGLFRFLIILAILILLVTLVRRSIAGSGEKKS